MDPPVTPAFPDYTLDDQPSDETIRQGDNSMILPSTESEDSYLSEISLFTKQRRAHHLTSPTYTTTSIPVKSHTISHLSLSLLPDPSPEVSNEDILAGVIPTRNRMQDKIKLNSRGSTSPMLTHTIIPFSIIVSILVQIQSRCQPLR